MKLRPGKNYINSLHQRILILIVLSYETLYQTSCSPYVPQACKTGVGYEMLQINNSKIVLKIKTTKNNCKLNIVLTDNAPCWGKYV